MLTFIFAVQRGAERIMWTGFRVYVPSGSPTQVFLTLDVSCWLSSTPEGAGWVGGVHWTGWRWRWRTWCQQKPRPCPMDKVMTTQTPQDREQGSYTHNPRHLFHIHYYPSFHRNLVSEQGQRFRVILSFDVEKTEFLESLWDSSKMIMLINGEATKCPSSVAIENRGCYWKDKFLGSTPDILNQDIWILKSLLQGILRQLVHG